MQHSRLANCIICGKLFILDRSEICLDCHKEVENDFKKVIEFLSYEDNHNSTLEMISDKTKVSIKRITEFIRAGRIIAEDFPNLSYPCSHCGKLIKRNFLCYDCFELLTSDIHKVLNKDKIVDEIDHYTNNMKLHTKRKNYEKRWWET